MTAGFRSSRRRVLRGMMGGAAVTVGLPFLDCFLDSTAAPRSPPPARRCRFVSAPGSTAADSIPGAGNRGRRVRTMSSASSCSRSRLSRHQLNVYSQMSALLDGRPRGGPHGSDPAVIVQGTTPPTLEHPMNPEPSIDALIADVIGSRTRFRSLEVSCTGSPAQQPQQAQRRCAATRRRSRRWRSTRAFSDRISRTRTRPASRPTRRSWRAAACSRRSASRRKQLMRQLGAADRAHLDQYFTRLRELEQQLDLQLQKPAPLAACSAPRSRAGTPVGTEVAEVTTNHRLFARLLAHALACDQTRVFNVMLTDGLSQLRFAGEANTHHLFTHEDPIDEKLGYQPNVAKFFPIDSWHVCHAARRAWTASAKATARCSIACWSSTTPIRATPRTTRPTTSRCSPPAAPAAGCKPAIHFAAAKGDPVTRLSLTVQQAMGVPISSFGTESNQTSKTITEVMA